MQAGGLLQLDRSPYLAGREREIGRLAADVLLCVCETLDPDVLERVFPEFVAAGARRSTSSGPVQSEGDAGHR